jgi:hypothetical protein
MLIPRCDRCKQDGQVVPVIGRDLCNACMRDLGEWLNAPMDFKRRWCGKVDRADQALRLLERSTQITSEQVAALNGETRRAAYQGLIHLCKLGIIVHLGRGVFAMPSAQEAAE